MIKKMMSKVIKDTHASGMGDEDECLDVGAMHAHADGRCTVTLPSNGT